jgi:hypothetical protein
VSAAVGMCGGEEIYPLNKGIRPCQAPARGGGGAEPKTGAGGWTRRRAGGPVAAGARYGWRAARMSRRLGFGISAAERSGRPVRGWVLPPPPQQQSAVALKERQIPQ